MKIIVLIKQVPDTTQLSTTVNGLQLLGEGAARVFSPWDEYALETALQLKEKHGGSVAALSVGPIGASEALRTAIAMGADEAVLISDPALINADTLTTAQVLAAASRKIGAFDLIVGGRTAVDGSSAATAVQVAALLDIPAISYVAALKAVDTAAKTITATRLLEGSRQVVSSTLPALITVVKEINEPRYPTIMNLRKAKKAVVPIWNLADLNVTLPAKPRVTWQVSLPPVRETRLELFATPTQLADRLIEQRIHNR